MRAVVILALAAFLCATASAAVVTTQEEAKNLKNDWPACSQIVQGRLGSLTPAGTPTSNPYSINAAVSDTNHSGWVQYWPCVTHPVSGNVLPTGTGNLFVSIGSTQAVYTASSTKFSMPAQKNDVAKFVATMTVNPGHSNSAPSTAIVTTSCAETDNNVASPNGTYTMTGSGASKTLNVFLTDINACARFPYTNSNVPGGAVAAIIVVIACFVIQFSICGWYHWTHKQDTPLDHQME